MVRSFMFFNFIFLFSLNLCFSFQKTYDLTVVGSINHADGIGRQSIGLIDLLKDDLKINFIPTQINTKDVSSEVQKIIFNPNKIAGVVSILEDPLWYSGHPNYKKMPNSKIKLAYSMLESSEIPPKWVKILNKLFDAVIVPDQFLIGVYKDCGVNIPIFELPLGMYLDELLEREKRKRPSTPFVFGTTVSCDSRKNYPLLIEAFAEEFGNAENVVLKLNSRHGDVALCQNLINSLDVSNIIFTNDVLNKEEYLDFLDSFDCFVNVSKGEGFSLCPREALALGIPCILTNNSAQTTICNTGLIKSIPCDIVEEALYGGLFGNRPTGNFLSCTKEEIRLALRKMYKNYSFYLQKAEKGPVWARQYSWKNLRLKYLNLIKPKVVLFGEKNEITDDYFMTDSRELYLKYMSINKHQGFKKLN